MSAKMNDEPVEIVVKKRTGNKIGLYRKLTEITHKEFFSQHEAKRLNAVMLACLRR